MLVVVFRECFRQHIYQNYNLSHTCWVVTPKICAKWTSSYSILDFIPLLTYLALIKFWCVHQKILMKAVFLWAQTPYYSAIILNWYIYIRFCQVQECVLTFGEIKIILNWRCQIFCRFTHTCEVQCEQINWASVFHHFRKISRIVK